MNELADSILYSLDGGQDPRIYPYLPFLLQDLWELGTPVETIIKLIKNHKDYLQGKVHVLDLGCSKGAVPVNLARQLSEKYPDKKDIFAGYLQTQRKENNVLDNEVISVTGLLQQRVINDSLLMCLSLLRKRIFQK